MYKIITIGRQYGSNGTEIAKALALQLNIPYYDKNSLRSYAIENGLGKILIDSYGEKHAQSLLYTLSTNAFSFGYYNAAQDSTVGQKVYLTAFETIREVAKKGPCVIVGRCADYVLRDNAFCMSFFIHSPLPVRVETVAHRCEMGTLEAEEKILEQDRLRRSYYNYYTQKNWGEVDSYHIAIDSSIHGIKNTASLMQQILYCNRAEDAVRASALSVNPAC